MSPRTGIDGDDIMGWWIDRWLGVARVLLSCTALGYRGCSWWVTEIDHSKNHVFLCGKLENVQVSGYRTTWVRFKAVKKHRRKNTTTAHRVDDRTQPTISVSNTAVARSPLNALFWAPFARSRCVASVMLDSVFAHSVENPGCYIGTPAKAQEKGTAKVKIGGAVRARTIKRVRERGRCHMKKKS